MVIGPNVPELGFRVDLLPPRSCALLKGVSQKDSHAIIRKKVSIACHITGLICLRGSAMATNGSRMSAHVNTLEPDKWIQMGSATKRGLIGPKMRQRKLGVFWDFTNSFDVFFVGERGEVVVFNYSPMAN